MLWLDDKVKRWPYRLSARVIADPQAGGVCQYFDSYIHDSLILGTEETWPFCICTQGVSLRFLMTLCVFLTVIFHHFRLTNLENKLSLTSQGLERQSTMNGQLLLELKG